MDVVCRRLDAVSDRATLTTLLGVGPGAPPVVEIAEELWTHQDLWAIPLQEIFPGLGSITGDLPLESASRRLRNILMGAHLPSWAALAPTTPLQLAGLRNYGRTCFTETVRLIIVAWAADCQLTAGPTPVDPASESTTREGSRQLRRAVVIEEAATILARLWRETGVETLAEALAEWQTANGPAQVDKPTQAVLRTRLDEILALPIADEESWKRLLDVGPRDMVVLEGRVYAEGKRQTLDELGVRLEVSRERVRQVERRTRDLIEKRLCSGGGCEELMHIAERVRREVGQVCSREAAIEKVDIAVRAMSDPPPSGPLRRNVLLALIGPYREEEDILLSDFARTRLDETMTSLAEVGAGAELPSSLVEEIARELAVPAVLHGWLEDRLGVRYLNGRHVVWNGSMADKAVSTLLAVGEPMTLGQIHEKVGFEYNPRSLAGQVQGDPRVIRRGRDLYGLRAWGGEEYTGIVEELEQAIERAGEPISLEQTVEQFVRDFGVSAGSVRSYAADRRFIRERDGGLRFRTASDPVPEPRRRPIEETRGLFLIDGVWHLRIEVDRELLRGTGRATSAGVAIAAGLEPDLTIGTDFGAGPVTFSWSRSQPDIGSLRPTAAHCGCTEEDLLFLPLTGTEPRTCRVVRAVDRRRGSGLARVAGEMGLDAEVVEAGPGATAAAVGLPAGADWYEIEDRLRGRGDIAIAELLALEAK